MTPARITKNRYSMAKTFVLFTIFLSIFFVSNVQIANAEGRWKGDGNGGCYWDPVDTGPNQCDPNSTGGTGGNGSNSSWPQDIQYSITGNGVVGYYNVATNGNKIFNWDVTVSAFNGPGTMHVVTIGAYDDTAGSAGTTAHGFSVPASGKVDYRNPPESGNFSFSYDTRYRTCGRVQIDGSFIDESTGSDKQLFFATVIDYGVDCVAPVNQKPVITLLGLNPVTVTVGGSYIDAGATALDPEDGNITANIVKTGIVNLSVVGTYTLTYNVSDSQGLAAIPVTRTVNVIPANNRPVITLVGSNPVNITVGNSYTDAGATAFDIEDGNITANIVRTGTVNTSVVGTSTITYNVSDSKGLAAIPVTRTVVVVEAPVNNRPVITLIGSSTVSVIAGSLYIDQGATAFDIEDGNITANIVRSGTVNTSVVGTSTVTYNVSDSKGLAAIPVTRTVIVTNANQKPVITLVGSNPITVIVGSNYVDAGATAFDIEDGDITPSIATTSTVNINTVGTYTTFQTLKVWLQFL
jgi:energy-converting hydrogenase Eha subunit C